jgi:hypothetical protein
LLVSIGFLILASSLGVAWFIAYPPVEQIPVWVMVFNVNVEGNIPTLFSSLQLVAAAVLLSGIGYCHRHEGQPYALWYALAVIFLFLAIDETSALHENLTVRVRTALGTSGYLYFAWVIPYGIAVLLLAAVFARFLLRLPRSTMSYFIMSGTIYLAGTLGFEMLGGNYISLPGAQEITYSVIYTVEEALEMIGIALFIYALMKYITSVFLHLDYSVRD